MRVVTTSWDDGDPNDIKIADLLRSRKLPGTFYVPITGYQGRKTLCTEDLRTLCSEGFEIGGHSVSHKRWATKCSCSVIPTGVSMRTSFEKYAMQDIEARERRGCCRLKPIFLHLKCRLPCRRIHILIRATSEISAEREIFRVCGHTPRACESPPIGLNSASNSSMRF